MTKVSSSVPIKQLNASLGELTIGSPLTLKEVFTITGHPVFSLNFVIKSKDNKKFIFDNFLYGDIHWNKNGTKIIFENIIKNIEF